MSEHRLVADDIEWVLECRRMDVNQDRVRILIWSGRPAIGKVATARRLWLRRPTRRGQTVRADVYYAERSVGSVMIAPGGGLARLSFVHAGPHLDPALLSIRSGQCGVTLGARVVIEARSRTDVEGLASALWPELAGRAEPFPNCAEMLALRRAVTR